MNLGVFGRKLFSSKSGTVFMLNVLGPRQRKARNPSSEMRFWAVIIAPQHRLEPTKAQIFDDTLILDQWLWLGHLLGALRHAAATNDAHIFRVPLREQTQIWKTACTTACGNACRAAFRVAATSVGWWA